MDQPHVTGRRSAGDPLLHGWLQGATTLSTEQVLATLDVDPDEGALRGLRLVVIDDAHALRPSALRALVDRLSAEPDGPRVLLLSRCELGPVLSRSPLGRQATTLRGDLLYLEDDEAVALAKALADTDDPELIGRLIDHAHGWLGMLVLMARSIGTNRDPESAVRQCAHVGADLAGEAFAALGALERRILMCTTGIRTFSADDVIALTQDPRARDGLVALASTGMLVDAVAVEQLRPNVDPDEVLYVVHPLLADVVRRQCVVGGVDVDDARIRVVRWARMATANTSVETIVRRLIAVGAVEAASGLMATDGLRLAVSAGAELLAPGQGDGVDPVEVPPERWFTIAYRHWIRNELDQARAWLNRVAHDPGGRAGPLRVACSRLMRARLGLEPLEVAAKSARGLAAGLRGASSEVEADPLMFPTLLLELGATELWLGRVGSAERHLSTAVGLADVVGSGYLRAEAGSQLALARLMMGHENSGADRARSVLAGLATLDSPVFAFARSRAQLVLNMAAYVDAPYAKKGLDPVPARMPVHGADLCIRFAVRSRRMRLALTSGSIAEGARILAAPLDVPVAGPLPGHLQRNWLFEHVLIATLTADASALTELERRLQFLGAPHEAALAAGFRADLAGDRRLAAVNFAVAARAPEGMSATRALALACEAQLLDSLDEHELALDRLGQAIRITEVRRNAGPFLGWSRVGTPVATLLDAMLGGDDAPGMAWAREVCSGATDAPTSLIGEFSPSVAHARERRGSKTAMGPTLSPRERQVLAELARGATYADVAASLHLSGNTIKTHVSSLYGKLGVSCRSDALVAARNLHLI